MRSVRPNAESQIYIAEALDWPASIVRADDWPKWLPLTANGIIPPAPSSVPTLQRGPADRNETSKFLTITSTALSALPADWASGSHNTLAQARDGKPAGMTPHNAWSRVEQYAEELADPACHLADTSRPDAWSTEARTMPWRRATPSPKRC
jgi:hypothetical protein